MAEKILGPAGSKRRKRFLWVPALLIACTALFVIGNAQAVHDLQFQLDGNAIASDCGTGPSCKTSGTGAGQIYDWSSLFDANGNTNTSLVKKTNTVGFTNATFTRDFTTKASKNGSCNLDPVASTFCTSDSSTYATGSKDTLPIHLTSGSDWQCNKDNNVNSKIDIMNSYAAAYTAPNGDKILYFGLDKNKDNGDNDVGFWFLQGDAGCTAGANATDFTGEHHDGDILITSAFTSGGGVSNIEVFKWTGDNATGCIDNPADPTLCDQKPFGTGGDCKNTPTSTTTAPADAICATTNSGTLPSNGNITTPWQTADATLGIGNTVVPPDFFEGGIDLTLAFKNVNQTAPSCFNTFIADTRSSQQPTATLFDYTAGTLGECTSGLTTTPSSTLASPVTPGTAVSDIATFVGSSSGGSAPNPSSPPNVFFSICGPIPVSSTVLGCDASDSAHTAAAVSNQPWVHCTGAGTPSAFCTAANPQGTSEAKSSSVSKTDPGIYCWKATWAGDVNYSSGASDIGNTTTGTECYRVKDTSTVTTEQRWLPNDTAHVRNSSGGAASGSVVFTLYVGTGDCVAANASSVITFPSSGSTALDSSGDASTSNSTTYVATQPGTTISWKVDYTPTDSNAISGSSSSCESSVLTINNNPNVP